jgi:uncharacterized protein YnzC (UPF0291/DUF896 family)
VADELGTAVLKITVDDGPARQKLRELRDEIGRTGNSVGTSRRGSSSSNSASKAERDLEVLKEKRFRLARRIDALEERGVATSRLRTQLGRLTTAYAERDVDLARKYARELARSATLEEQRARSAARRRRVEERAPARGLDRTPIQGSVREVGSPRFINNAIRQGGRTESIDALFQAQKKRYSLDQQIRSLETAGVNTDRLRAELGRVTEAQAQRRFGTAKQLGDQLNFQLRKERDILNTRLASERATTRQSRAAEAEGRRIGRLNASPVNGGAAFPGSPAFIQAAADRRRKVEKSWDLALRQLGETAEVIRENAIAEGRRIGRLNAVPVGGNTATGLIPGSPAAINAAAAQRRRDLKEGRRVGQLNTSPVRGGAAFPGSPAFLDAQFPAFPAEFFRKQKQDQAKQQRAIEQGIKRRNDILSNALIGGAFPALFGQGFGASLGGAAGGAAGGAIGGQFGFGLSLVGTALGAQFDAALNKAKELAKALDNPIAQFSAIKENALLSSKGLEKNVEALIATGREAEAAALIQEDLAKKFGNPEEVQRFANETDKLNRAWTETTVTLAAFVSGPLADLVGKISSPLRANTTANQLARAQSTLSPTQLRELRQFERRKQNELGITPTGGLAVAGVGASDAQVVQLNLSLLQEIERIQGKNNGALEKAARNQNVLVQSARTLVKFEEAIGRARLGGNKPLEDSIALSRELLTSYRDRKNIEQQLAAGQIKAAQATELTGQSLAKDRTLRQDYVDSSRESLINSVKELTTVKQLSGLEGTRLEVAQRRIELSKAFGLRELRGQQLTDARTNASLNPGNENFRVLFQGALQNFTAAGVDFETKLRQASDYLKRAAKDAATNLTNALIGAGKLESDPGGLNRFLTPEEQFQSNRRAILRLGGDGRGTSQLESAIAKATELLGLTRNQANERFQGLRDIVSGARQGRFASQEGFNTLSGFFQDTLAREQAVTGVADAQKTLADITSLNVTVQKELVGAVQQNTVALNAVFGKDWSVNLAVQGGEVAAYGDVISRNLTP